MDIDIYDVIGADFYGEGVTAKWLRGLLEQAGPDEPITLRINSPGGDVMEAVTMATLLREHKGPVEAQIDGLAASAASYLAATIGKVSMANGGLYMIHNPWTVEAGDAAAMRKTADLLDKVRENIAASYVSKSGMDLKAVQESMDEETWYTAEEAKEKGLVDEVLDVTVKGCAIPKTLGYKNGPSQLREGEGQKAKSADKGGKSSKPKNESERRRGLPKSVMQQRIALARASLR